jgi:hypothetical protein
MAVRASEVNLVRTCCSGHTPAGAAAFTSARLPATSPNDFSPAQGTQALAREETGYVCVRSRSGGFA